MSNEDGAPPAKGNDAVHDHGHDAAAPSNDHSHDHDRRPGHVGSQARGHAGHDHAAHDHVAHDLDGAHEHGATHDHCGAHDHDEHAGDHGHASKKRGHHGHTHGQLAATDSDALRVVTVSTIVLGAVAAAELVVAIGSGSAGVLADGLHNLGDVSTTVALAAAFLLSRRAPSQRFPYGYHRTEDLAGLLVLLLMVISAVASGVTAVEHFMHPPVLHNLGLALAVAIAGVAGNEGVAQYKIRAGRRLGSMALAADGEHSRIDGLASLGAAVGVAGAWGGMPMLDPAVAAIITLVIAWVAWDTGRNVTRRLLDEADASLIATITDVAVEVPGVIEVTEVRARWTGRKVRVELCVAVDPETTVSAAHAIGEEVRHRLHHRVASLAEVMLHLDPAGEPGAHAASLHHAGASA